MCKSHFGFTLVMKVVIEREREKEWDTLYYYYLSDLALAFPRTIWFSMHLTIINDLFNFLYNIYTKKISFVCNIERFFLKWEIIQLTLFFDFIFGC